VQKEGYRDAFRWISNLMYSILSANKNSARVQKSHAILNEDFGFLVKFQEELNIGEVQIAGSIRDFSS